MTVAQLRDALAEIDGSRRVFIAFSNEDERGARAVTFDGHILRVCDTAEEMSPREKLLHNDNERVA